MNTDEIIAGATPRYDDAGQPIRKMTTCGTCGRTWDDNAISSLTPTPAGRCPWEAEHKTTSEILDAAGWSTEKIAAAKADWDSEHEAEEETEGGATMTDKQALELLRLLHLYVTSYPATAALASATTVADVAEDCVSSMSEYLPEAETLNDEIAAALA